MVALTGVLLTILSMMLATCVINAFQGGSNSAALIAQSGMTSPNRLSPDAQRALLMMMQNQQGTQNDPVPRQVQ